MSKLKAKWLVPTEETPQQHIRMLRRRLDNKILNSWLKCDDVNKPPSVQHSLMKWQTKITLAFHTIPYSQYLDVEFVFWPLITRHPLLRQAHHRLIIPGCMSLAFWGPVGICPPDPETLATEFCSVQWVFFMILHRTCPWIPSSLCNLMVDVSRKPLQPISTGQTSFPTTLLCLKCHICIP